MHYATGQKIVASIHKIHVDVYTAVYIYLTQVDCVMVVYWTDMMELGALSALNVRKG